MMKYATSDAHSSTLLQNQSNEFVVIKIRRSTAFAFLFSLLIHGIVLFAYVPKETIDTSSVARSLPQSISVRLAELPAKKSLSPVKPKSPPPVVIAVDKSSPIPTPQKAPPTPLISTNRISEKSAPIDFMSFVKAKKLRDQELEDYAARVNASAHEPSQDELRDENIKRNLQQHGTSGIFEIKHKSLSTAQFSFKGWKNDYSLPKLEIIEVSAGPDGNIDSAIVKKMIEIIRREYKGDFNWESQRLGRVIILSARPGDNSGLEEFLTKEFFSTGQN